MATRNERGGWDPTDDDVAEVMAASFSGGNDSVSYGGGAMADIARGPINWHFKAEPQDGRMTFTMRSSVRPTTFLTMWLDEAGWGGQ